jgi:hypothetical protein
MLLLPGTTNHYALACVLGVCSGKVETTLLQSNERLLLTPKQYLEGSSSLEQEVENVHDDGNLSDEDSCDLLPLNCPDTSTLNSVPSSLYKQLTELMRAEVWTDFEELLCSNTDSSPSSIEILAEYYLQTRR